MARKTGRVAASSASPVPGLLQGPGRRAWRAARARTRAGAALSGGDASPALANVPLEHAEPIERCADLVEPPP